MGRNPNPLMADRYAALTRALSSSNFVLWDTTNDAPVTEHEWHRRGGVRYRDRVALKDTATGNLVLSCTVQNIVQLHWRLRRSEIAQIGLEEGFHLNTTPDAWVRACTGKNWRPVITCHICKEEVSSTTIHNLLSGRRGCACRTRRAESAEHWRFRRAEIVSISRARNFHVLTSEVDWIAECRNQHWCPEIQCSACLTSVTSTSIHNILKGELGCGCSRKTEQLLFAWLSHAFSSMTVRRNHPGPERTRFDFFVTAPQFHFFVELDGEQHFWPCSYLFDAAACKRDVMKEDWALCSATPVIRLLQADVWNDRYDWRGWILSSARRAEQDGTARVYTPDTPEYRSTLSEYVRLRR